MCTQHWALQIRWTDELSPWPAAERRWQEAQRCFPSRQQTCAGWRWRIGRRTEGKSREGWIREWNGTRVGDTCRETLWNFVSCKEESVCACETDGQTEAVFSSCRPRCYVSSMWHIQPVHGAKTQQLPPHPPPPLLTQTWSLGRPSASGHNLILLYLVWSDNKASYLNLSLLWKNGYDKNKLTYKTNRI